nr:penicillin acylase family protein [Thermoleophilaceae bacterium]
EVISFRPPPSSFIPSTSNPKLPNLPESGSRTERICRTVHGPVQSRAGGKAYARRYAIWGRELETLEGIADLNAAQNIAGVDAAMAKVTWNENVVAVDEAGNIGFWHPGLLPLRPRDWDERLPYPGTGEAEWDGFLTVAQRPHVINPKLGYLHQWNNVPSKLWTSGDGPARERLNGPFHRGNYLKRAVAAAAKQGGGYEVTRNVDRIAGTTAQQRPLFTSRLKKAQKGATGQAKIVLDTIRSWDGSYSRTTPDGKTEPGLAAWDAFKKASIDVALGRFSTNSLNLLEGGRSTSHEFDATNLESYSLRVLSPKGYRVAAERAFRIAQKRFSSGDPQAWRSPRKMYQPTSQGAATFKPFPFFDRGTVQHVTELGP